MKKMCSYDSFHDIDLKSIVLKSTYDKYIRWMGNLPYYRVEGHTIFCHAGIDEEAGELWEWGTGEHIFTSKYPAEVGKIEGLDMIVVAGHVGTAEISGDPGYHDIYYDGKSHIFLDGTVWKSGKIPVLMVETGDDRDKYYRVTENVDVGNNLVLEFLFETDGYGCVAYADNGMVYLKDNDSILLSNDRRTISRTYYKDYKTLKEEAHRQFPGASLSDEKKVKYNI